MELWSQSRTPSSHQSTFTTNLITSTKTIAVTSNLAQTSNCSETISLPRSYRTTAPQLCSTQTLAASSLLADKIWSWTNQLSLAVLSPRVCSMTLSAFTKEPTSTQAEELILIWKELLGSLTKRTSSSTCQTLRRMNSNGQTLRKIALLSGWEQQVFQTSENFTERSRTHWRRDSTI